MLYADKSQDEVEKKKEKEKSWGEHQDNSNKLHQHLNWRQNHKCHYH